MGWFSTLPFSSFSFSFFSLNLWGIKRRQKFFLCVLLMRSFFCVLFWGFLFCLKGGCERKTEKRFKWWNILWYCDENRRETREQSSGVAYGKINILFCFQHTPSENGADMEVEEVITTIPLRLWTLNGTFCSSKHWIIQTTRSSFHTERHSNDSKPKRIKHRSSFREKMALQVLDESSFILSSDGKWNEQWWKTFSSSENFSHALPSNTTHESHRNVEF